MQQYFLTSFTFFLIYQINSPCSSISSYLFSAICQKSCLNNGVCRTPGKCECPSGYFGDRCEESKNYLQKFWIIPPLSFSPNICCTRVIHKVSGMGVNMNCSTTQCVIKPFISTFTEKYTFCLR